MFSDYFGFSSLFYTYTQIKGEGILLAGTSFRSVVSALRELTDTVKINWPVVFPHLVTTHNLFRTRASYKTFAEDIYVLATDEILVLENGKLCVHKRKPLQNSSASYTKLIEDGINNAVKQIQYLSSLNLPSTLLLSGGKDSRMLLALLIASGKEQNFAISTTNPHSLPAGPSKDILMSDLKIAARLKEKYGLAWKNSKYVTKHHLTFDETIQRWQNYRSGNSFEMSLEKAISTTTGGGISLMGIGGELIRSYLGKNYRTNYPTW